MLVEVKVPSPGESIQQVQLANWLVENGDFVEKDQEIVEIDTDKASLSISAPEGGIINILVNEGESVAVGFIICTIETDGKRKEMPSADQSPAKAGVPVIETKAESSKSAEKEIVKQVPSKRELHITPLARKLMEESKVSDEQFAEMLKGMRISRQDVKDTLTEKLSNAKVEIPGLFAGQREAERKKMSTLRLKLSERLVAVKNQTAMLTTFNEVNMSQVLGIKSKFNDKFKEKYGVSIGLMSFFTKAVTLALEEFPQLNSQIDGEDLVIPHYVDMGIAVSSPKGLVVPVVRNAESLSLAQIEAVIKDLGNRARNNKISLEEMTGGTFTISNGGVFGSMMSTPILNPPQSAILGMHSIIERPVAVMGKVIIQPMMYLALSYDHRVIDGKEAVSFLVRVKEIVENPVRMLTRGTDPESVILGL